MFRLPFGLFRKPHPVVVPGTLTAIDDAADAAAAELLLGPGWFDSSWDLQRGLEVREGLPANASVSEWLTVRLAELS